MDPLKLELQSFVSYLMWVMETTQILLEELYMFLTAEPFRQHLKS